MPAGAPDAYGRRTEQNGRLLVSGFAARSQPRVVDVPFQGVVGKQHEGQKRSPRDLATNGAMTDGSTFRDRAAAEGNVAACTAALQLRLDGFGSHVSIQDKRANTVVGPNFRDLLVLTPFLSSDT